MSDAFYEAHSVTMQRFCMTMFEGSTCWCFVSVFVPFHYCLRQGSQTQIAPRAEWELTKEPDGRIKTTRVPHFDADVSWVLGKSFVAVCTFV